MKKKLLIICTFIILSVGLVYLFLFNTNRRVEREIVYGYSFETTEKNIINKSFDGTYLDSFVTIALDKENFTINLEGLSDKSKVFIINPNTGEMTQMQNEKEGRFSINTSLEKDINYGIIMDYKLIGSIIVLENLDIPDKDNFYMEILEQLGCGL